MPKIMDIIPTVMMPLPPPMKAGHSTIGTPAISQRVPLTRLDGVALLDLPIIGIPRVTIRPRIAEAVCVESPWPR